MDEHIVNEKEIIVNFFDEFSININELENSDDFLEMILKSIISVKIWNNNISIPNASLKYYLIEIISNLNQIALLAIQGYKIASFILLRRCIENMFQILFYKDHKIEFYRKIENKELQYKRIDEFNNYLSKFPFASIYPNINSGRLQNLVNKLSSEIRENYKNLSDFVHGTTLENLELAEFIEDITPNKDFLSIINTYIVLFMNHFSAFFIIFFFSEFKNFDPREKEWIRDCIDPNSRLLREIRNIFREI